MIPSLMSHSDSSDLKSPQDTNIVMTLLVRNEEDIVDWNLKFHYSLGVNFVIATDNNSVDATPEILRHYEKEGKLHYIREDSDDYSQGKWVTRMARLAATEYNADWVINNDADEFWLPLQGDLRQTLSSIDSATGCISYERLNFPPVTSDSQASLPFWRRMVIRQSSSTNYLGKPLPRKVCHRGHPSVSVEQGNHAVQGIPGEQQTLDTINILHFPIRTYNQFETKIALGGAAYERNSTLPKRVGSTWRLLYEMYKRGQLRDWYNQQLIPSTSCSEKLSISPGFVLDTRLRSFFSASTR